MGVRQLVGGYGERDIAERRQRAGAVGGEFADGMGAVAMIGPAVVDVPALLRFVVSHADILTGAAPLRDYHRLLYAGQQ